MRAMIARLIVAMIFALAMPSLLVAQDAGSVVGTATLPRDLTPWGMYLDTDPVVKVVLIGLAIASMVTWTVWLTKTVDIVWSRRQIGVALRNLGLAASMAEAMERLAGTQGEVRELLEAAATEQKLSTGVASADGIKERV